MATSETVRVELPDGPAGRSALVYRPATNPGIAAPVVLDIHGGAWTWFDAAVDALWCRALARAGWLVVSAEFTSSLEAPWPAGLRDLQAVLSSLRHHAGDLGGDPERITVLGGSTGGHYAAMLGLLGDSERRRPDAVVALWPILDVVARYEMVRGAGTPTPDGPSFDGTAARLDRLAELVERRPALGHRVGSMVQHLNAIGGRVPPVRRALYERLAWAHEATFPGGVVEMAAASPVVLLEAGPGVPALADGALPPLLVVHAAADTNTTEAMARRAVGLWRERGGDAQLDIVAGVGHSYGNVASPQSDDLVDAIVAFLAPRSDRPHEESA